MQTFKKILFLLTPKERRLGALVLCMVIVMALLETAGVASVMPFLSVLGNPEVVNTNQVLSTLYHGLGFESEDTFLMALGAAAFMVIIFSTAFRTLTHYAMNRFIQMRQHSIGERLLETYLRQPYTFFLDRHSGDLTKNILSEVDQLIIQVFNPFMMMIAYSVVILSIVGLMLFISPLMTIGVAVVFGGMYLLVYLLVRGTLARSGRDRVKANQERFTEAGEALGGIKEIKLLGREHAYLSRFRGPSIRQARHQATNLTISKIPKFAIEAVAFGGIIALILVLLALQGGVSGGTLGEILPILGLFAFAAYKLLPAAQIIFQGFAKLRFGMAALDGVCDDLYQRSALAEIFRKDPQPLVPSEKIILKDLTYTYPNAASPALKDINLDIPVGTSVGLVGSTGSGKTTMVDVLLGLLHPQQGQIYVDETPIFEVQNSSLKAQSSAQGGNSPLTNHNSLRAWQQALGYVPQDIFLTDSTVTENIALGVPKDQIELEQVMRCARMAQVHDFIVQEMPNGYDTLVGERGVRLSGGQRQRIGIARALYHDPQVLIFDEATSALDTVTEKAVMQAIDDLSRLKTVIIIAHRLSTVQKCDKVVLLEKGRVSASGTFEQLTRRNDSFRNMAVAAGS